MFERLLDPMVILVTWPVILFSLSFHEFMHAWSADRLGDHTARYMGRLTLNPIAHYHPIGTTLILLFGTFGWAKPVPMNPAGFRWPKRDMMLSAFAGPASNIVLALCCVVIFKILVAAHADFASAPRPLQLIERMAGYGVFINFILALFNLLPLYPLDGHHILRGFLPFNALYTYDRYIQWSMYLLLVLVVAGSSVFSVLIFQPRLAFINLAFSEGELFRLSLDLKGLF